MANETESIVLNTIHNVTHYNSKHSRYRTAIIYNLIDKIFWTKDIVKMTKRRKTISLEVPKADDVGHWAN